MEAEEEAATMFGGYYCSSSSYYPTHHHHHQLIIVRDDDDDDDDDAASSVTVTKTNNTELLEDNDDEDDGGCHHYLSFNTYPSSYLWISLQLLWRFTLSFLAALLVFFIVTNPPPPHLSILQQTRMMKELELAEGVDSWGVATNLLSCNISISILIDNKSTLYSLRTLSSPLIQIYFGPDLLAAVSQGAKVYTGRHEMKRYEMYGGTRKKAMYGGGRNMQELLHSDRGLPLLVTLTFTSYFQLIFIHPKFNHNITCLLFIKQQQQQQQHYMPYNNSSCLLTSS